MKILNTFIDIKLLKFVIVGVINTLVGMAIMFGLFNLLGCSYWVSSAANYILTSILSFFLNKYFTFESKNWSWMEVLKFILNIIVCYIIAYGIAKPLTLIVMSGFNNTIRLNVALFVGMCLFTVLNYLGQRFFAFK